MIVGVSDMELVAHTVPQEEGETLSVALAVEDCVAVGNSEWVISAESEREGLGDAEVDPGWVGVTLAVTMEVWVSARDADPVPQVDKLGVAVAEKVAVKVPEAHPLPDALGRGEVEGTREVEVLPVGAFVAEAQELREGDPVPPRVRLAYSDEEGEGVTKEEGLGSRGLPEGDSVPVKLGVGVGLPEVDSEPTPGEGDAVADKAELIEGAGDCDEDGVWKEEVLEVRVGIMEGVPEEVVVMVPVIERVAVLEVLGEVDNVASDGVGWEEKVTEMDPDPVGVLKLVKVVDTVGEMVEVWLTESHCEGVLEMEEVVQPVEETHAVVLTLGEVDALCVTLGLALADTDRQEEGETLPDTVPLGLSEEDLETE